MSADHKVAAEDWPDQRQLAREVGRPLGGREMEFPYHKGRLERRESKAGLTDAERFQEGVEVGLERKK